MELVDILATLNKANLDVARSFNCLNPVKVESRTVPLRLQENPYQLTDTVRRNVSGVATAHRLEEYRTPFYSIHLQEGIRSWLDVLLQIDLVEVE